MSISISTIESCSCNNICINCNYDDMVSMYNIIHSIIIIIITNIIIR